MSDVNDTFQKREQRIRDAVELKVPDRVPILLPLQFFPARQFGIQTKVAYYNFSEWFSAYEKSVTSYKPDLYLGPTSGIFSSGRLLEMIGMKQIKWPGYNLPDDATFQFVEGEYMKAESYDDFLEDPSDFLLRQYLPEICSNLSGLRDLPDLKTIASGYAAVGALAFLAMPQIKTALDALSKAIDESAAWTFELMAFTQRLTEKGFPMHAGGATLVPYDLISDMLRGMRGTMMDMYRCPDKLLAAQKKMLPFLIDMAINMCALTGVNRAFIPLNRGSDGFMSLKQFETFYWPDLKKMMIAFIEAGITPIPFFEGNYDQRIEYLNELPKGKVLGLFDRTDLVRAKEIIGDIVCIAGGMPITMLQAGTPEEVREHTKKMIDILGKDGGYIMAVGCPMDDARPELVDVWVEATREYGKY